jgi:hypothetical protein
LLIKLMREVIAIRKRKKIVNAHQNITEDI